MRRFALVAHLAFPFLLSLNQAAFAQAPVSSTAPTSVRDAQAVALLQASAAAMAKASPSDSVATGSVTLVAGSTTQQGTIRILTKGTSQTSVQVQTPDAAWSVIYSNSLASRSDGTSAKPLYMEQAASSRSAYFPYAIVADLVTNQDNAFTYIGQESLGQSPVQHIRAWNTFSSNPLLRFLTDFTVTDFWLDSASGLPLQISFVRRDGGGAAPRIPITVSYAKYQNVGGVLYPFQIEEFVNGTLWATTTIQSVSFNTGLTDADFPVSQGAN
ncbi:MAG: hypothetical protein ACRD59_03795 [Candidatus Acidiferrales bacterium]